MALTTVLLESRRITANVLAGVGGAYMMLLLVAILLKAVQRDLQFPWLLHVGSAISIGLLIISGALAQNIRAVTIPVLCWAALGLLVQPATRALSYAFENDQWVLVVLILAGAGFAATRGVRFVSQSDVDP